MCLFLDTLSGIFNSNTFTYRHWTSRKRLWCAHMFTLGVVFEWMISND